METPRSWNQTSSGSGWAMLASLHRLVNGYSCSCLALDWGIGRFFRAKVRGQGDVEIRVEPVEQGGTKAKL